MELLKELISEAFTIPGNRFFRVKKSIPFWWLSGHEPSNFHAGAAQVFRPIYTKTTLKPGDEIHVLVGGVRAVRKGGRVVVPGRVKEPGDFSPFERGSGGRPSEDAVALAKTGKTEEIDREEAIRVSYVPPPKPPKKF